jgi:spore coat protein U-like protein
MTEPGSALEISGASKRLTIKDGAVSLGVGQWDGATNRVESAGRKLFFTSYAGGIAFGNNGQEHFVLNTANNIIATGTITASDFIIA